MKPTRRTILLAALGTTGVAAIVGYGGSLLACNARASGRSAGVDPSGLTPALDDIIAASRVGRAYREERDRATLVDEFGAKPGLVAAAAQTCPTAMRAELRAQVEADFRNGDIVVADRFVMARSECILAALTV